MSEDLRIAWICNSSITVSETFLLDTHKLLTEIGRLESHCGEAQSFELMLENFEYHRWHQVRQTYARTILSKARGSNRVTKIRQRRCTNALYKSLTEFDPHILWIEFGTTAYVAKDLISRLNKPFIINVHGFDVSRKFNDFEYRQSFIELANSSKKVISASQFIGNKLLAHGIQEEKIQVIPLVVEVTEISNTPKTEHPSFVHFGRLSEVKGVNVLLHSFQRLLLKVPNARLTIIGHGEEAENLRRLTRQLNLNHSVRFHGTATRIEAHKLMATHWVMCQTNVTSTQGEQEAFGLSLAEAAKLGLPVIATNYGGITEHVEHGQSGILTSEWDINAVATAMIKLAQDPNLCNRMGQKGKEIITARFQREHRKDAIKQLIQAIK